MAATAGYRHTQIGTVTIVSVAAVVVLCAVLSAYTPEIRHVGMIAGAVLALTIPLFGWLTVTVDTRELTFRFGVGLVRRRYPIADIRGCEAVRNPWTYGWGIHLTPHGWLYNVSGLGAVEIRLSGGKAFRVGSDEPEALCLALRRAAGMGGRA
jgi:hypothetical protein